MSRHSDAEPSQRQLKVGEQLRHLLAETLLRGEVHDPRVREANLTVSEVRMSRDLKHATVFVNELGQELRPEVEAGLNRAATWLGGRAAREMNLKYAPRLRFVADPSFAEAQRIERLLDAELGDKRRRAGEDGERD